MNMLDKIPKIYTCKRCDNTFKSESITPIIIHHWLLKNTQNVFFMCRKCINTEQEFGYLDITYFDSSPIEKDVKIKSLYDLEGEP